MHAWRFDVQPSEATIGRGLLWLVLVSGGAATAQACDVPLYRHALVSHEPAAYELYFVADGPIAREQQELLERIERVIHRNPPHINLTLTVTNLQDDPQLESIRPDIRHFWQQQDLSEPVELESFESAFLVVNPAGILIHHGAMTSASVDRLLHSPIRNQICRSLEGGVPGVLVFLKGRESPAGQPTQPRIPVALETRLENDRVQQEMQALVEQMKQPDSLVPDSFVLVELDRDDRSDPWLVRTLLAVEPDLNSSQYEHQPMVFLIFGGGRALPPYIGQGISRENLSRELQYVTQVCACSIEGPLPGVDLLMNYPWQAVAAPVAAGLPPPVSSESAEGRGVFPDARETAPEARPSTNSEGSRTGNTDPAARNNSVPHARSDRSDPRSSAPRPGQTRPGQADPHAGDGGISRFCRNIYLMLASLALGYIGLFGALLLILRPRSSRR